MSTAAKRKPRLNPDDTHLAETVLPSTPSVQINRNEEPPRTPEGARGYVIVGMMAILGFLLAIYFGTSGEPIPNAPISKTSVQSAPALPDAVPPRAPTGQPTEQPEAGAEPTPPVAPNTTATQ
ncbi:MAG TPA: hypothetical protein VJ019_05885 [Aestuariivirga sp.]|jgi:hypothetical protein|nr:hypothetical protein [Aestuariivirga sp.]